MNTEFGAKDKNDFEKIILNFMNKSVFQKTIENIRKHRDTKIVTANRKKFV